MNRERVLSAAIDLADRDGIVALSMRKLAHELGVEAMSLYNHVANKDDILNGMVDRVFDEIGVPCLDVPWKTAMRQRAFGARAALLRHPWATMLLESRSEPGPATLRHHDAVIGCLRAAGFSVAMTAHAFALIDSYIYGFALQQIRLPVTTPEELVGMAATILQQTAADDYPHFTEMIVQHVLQPGYDFADEFEFGLELVLDGLERLRDRP